MTRLILGILLGIAVGVIDVLLMLPMKFPDKQTALLGAFSSRFAIGFLAANVTLPLPAIAAGALVGPLISIPDAILTPALQFGNICRWQRSHRRDLPPNPAMALCDKPARVRKVCGDKSQCINSRSCQALMLKYCSGNIPHPAKLFAECGLKSYLPTVQGERWPGSGLMRSAADGRFQLFPY